MSRYIALACVTLLPLLAAGAADKPARPNRQIPQELVDRQPALIDGKVAAIAMNSAPGAQVYFLGFAAYGDERVFAEEIELADQVGLDVFGVGEHHRPDYVASAPAVLLAAAAARTKRIKLASAVTVLSSDDPVRVYQQFATLDLISQGRAEIIVGRGSFIESYPLFGFDLGDYEELAAEKLELLLKIRAQTKVTWSGKHRAPLTGQGVYPRAARPLLPVYIGVGGTPQSVVRAAML